MIHHVSISARDPQHVAGVLAELMDGRSFPFPGPAADAFMAIDGDEHGTMIEVYPKSVTLQPGKDDLPGSFEQDATAEYGPFHLLLSVTADRAKVERIGEREGWRTRYFARGAPGAPPAFHVIEFWVENHLMIEVATPDMLADYLRCVRGEAPDQDAGADRRSAERV
jgi:hypothetical protein